MFPTQSECGVVTRRGNVLMGARQHTRVATKYPVADLRRQIGRNVPFVFDGQVADTLLCIEFAVDLKRARGTGTDAEVAGGTRSRIRLVRFECGRGHKFAQKDLRTERRMDQHVIGPDETQARPDRQGPFGQWDRIHTGFDPVSSSGPFVNEIRQFEQPWS